MEYLLLITGLLGAWEYGVKAGVVNAFLFGSPSGIWTFLVKGIMDGSIFHDMLVTSEETLLGFILGPMMEENLRRALLLSRGDWSVLVTRPLSAGLLAAAVLLVVIVALPAVKNKREEAFVED